MQGTLIAAACRRALVALVWLVVLAGVFVAVPAFADPKVEKDAQALQKKAVEEDFLNLDYPGAIKKLQGALAKCDGDKCGAPIKAALLRDLGAMQILAGSEGDGRASFGQALALDASLDLDPSYRNPQLAGIWSDAKKKAGGGGGGGGGGPAPQPSGDFAHTPALEAPVRTPLPVYAEYSGGETLARVILKYKAPGMAEWKPVDLPKLDGGFGGLIPCKDVTQGTMSYYIQGFNAANDPVATSGSRNKPYTVPIKAQIGGPAPSLPGQDPPKSCGDMAGAECPPDFPGCNNKKGAGEDCDKDRECSSHACVAGKCSEKKSGGEECSKDEECASGSCADDKCTAAKKAGGEDCESDDECDSGACKENKCSGGGGHGSNFRRVWIGVSVSLDLDVMPGANNVCSLFTATLNSAGYGCVDPSSGAAFPNQADNARIQLGRSDQVQGGIAHGPLALMLSFDYALTQNVLLGARAGYELFTDPALHAFAPVHLEGRFTYLFGRDALTKVAPMIFAGVGAGEFDAFVPVSVYLNAPTMGQTSQYTAGPNTPNKFNAWVDGGPFFVAGGGGVRIPMGESVAANVAVKVQGAFGGSPGFLFGLAPELGLQLGF